MSAAAAASRSAVVVTENTLQEPTVRAVEAEATAVDLELQQALQKRTDLAEACEQANDLRGAIRNWRLVLKIQQDLHKPESLCAITEANIAMLEENLAKHSAEVANRLLPTQGLFAHPSPPPQTLEPAPKPPEPQPPNRCCVVS